LVKQDLQGLELTINSPAALDMWNETMRSFLASSPSTGVNLGLTLEMEPSFAVAHACKGLFSLLSHNHANNNELIATAHEALMDAQASNKENPVTCEEHYFIGALAAWLGGDIEVTLSKLEAIVTRSPHNEFARRLHRETVLLMKDKSNMKAA